MNRMISIVTDRDYVVVEGVKIMRPSRISPSAWLAFWESKTNP